MSILCGKRGTFCTLLRRLGTVGKNEGCFWRSFFVAGTVFGKLGRCFERAEKRVLWNCRRIWFGAWWWWCIFCGRRSNYFVDLDKKVAATQVKRRFWLFQCSFFVVPAVFCENLTCARATVSSLCACRIALVAARCSFWDGSRPTQPSRHFGPVRSLSLWRGAHFDSQGDLAQRSWQGGLF